MEGVGELFGRSVDAVLRRPRPMLVPLLIDIGVLLLGTALFLSLAGRAFLFPQGYRLPNFPVAVPHALPTVGDVMGPEPAIHPYGAPAVLAAAFFILLLIPLLAYAEAGFLGVLRALYLTPDEAAPAGRHPDAWARVRDAFSTHARAFGGTFLWLRAIQAALALAALGLEYAGGPWANYGLGVLAVDVLLIYAPYAAVETRRGAFAAIRESVQLVSDHLATTLVALLFGFLLTGGISLLVAPLESVLRVATPFVMALLYAPVGTLLALFLYRVYLSFRPEAVPDGMAAPTASPAGA